MKKITTALFALLLCAGSFGCQNFVQNIDQPIGTVDDLILNREDQTKFVATGVVATFDDAYGQLSYLSDALSDAIFFSGDVVGATDNQYPQIDAGQILINNNYIIGVDRSLGRLRLLADTLVSRAMKIKYVDSSNRNLALFTGYFYGGIARYLYASYFGVFPDSGGGIINVSPFIPANTMYDLAIAKLQSALPYVSSPLQTRWIHSIISRIHLFKSEFDLARTEADLGLQVGDAPLPAKYDPAAANPWWANAGAGRVQFVVDPRFQGYLQSDPKDSSRILLLPAQSNSGATFFKQNKYPTDASPISFITWQENELMIAEIMARKGDSVGALPHVNAVRLSHFLDPRSATNIDSIYIERDKELFCTGNRLIDERRFNRWHLDPSLWMYLPISQEERNANPYIPKNYP